MSKCASRTLDVKGAQEGIAVASPPPAIVDKVFDLSSTGGLVKEGGVLGTVDEACPGSTIVLGVEVCIHVV